MPINASIEFEQARTKYDAAQTPSEKMTALQEMRSTAPSHKGGEKLRAEISGKIARLRKEMEKQRLQAKKSSGSSLNVKKEGNGQITIIGMPNTGKSFLLKKLTNADVEIASYPFTTTKPEIGMMDYKGSKTQLVEVPAIIKGSSGGKANGSQLLSLARNADACIITYNTDKEKETAVDELAKAGIIVNRKKPKIIIKQSQFKGITVSGKKFLKMSIKEFEKTMKSLGIHNASVVLQEETTLAKITEALDHGLDYKNCLFINPKKEEFNEELKKKIFSLLEKIIIYTKKPGEEADRKEPIVLKNNATIEDVAKVVHKEIAQKLKYARVWGSTKFPGQRKSKNHRLHTGDIVEIS